MRRRAPASASSSIRRMRPMTKSLPSLRNISSSRIRTRSAVVARARMSTVTFASARMPKAANITSTSWLMRKFVPTRMGGKRAAVAVAAQLVPGALQLELDAGLQVGIEDRGHGPLVLAHLAAHLVGQDHRQVADVVALVLLADDPAHRL